MPEMNGFEVLASLAPDRRPQAVIFTTAYDQYAVDAFSVSAVDYLLKPFSRARFDQAVTRARERMQTESRALSEDRLRALLRAAQRPEDERLAVRTPDATELIPIGAIDWAESEGNYINLHIGARALLMRDTIANLEERLADHGFVRIHRAILVNSARIVRMEPWSHGELIVVLRDGKKLKSGRTYSESLRRVAVLG
jgi:two-component system LytT family response regulator